LNLKNPSNLGEPPVEAAREAPTVVEIVDEPSAEGKAVEEIRTGAEPVLESVETGTGEEPVLADIGMRTGETPVLSAEAADFCFED